MELFLFSELESQNTYDLNICKHQTIKEIFYINENEQMENQIQNMKHLKSIMALYKNESKGHDRIR